MKWEVACFRDTTKFPHQISTNVLMVQTFVLMDVSILEDLTIVHVLMGMNLGETIIHVLVS